MATLWRAALLGLTVALAGACRQPPATPEARVRKLIDQSEAAAEARDVGALKGFVSDRYRDEQGLDKRALALLLAHEILAHQSLHLLTRVGSIDLSEPGRARVVVYVAMAGRPIASPSQLAGIKADIYRFDCGLVEEAGEWKVASAAWRPAELDDLQ